MAMAVRKDNTCLLFVVVAAAICMHMSLVQCRKLGPAEAIIGGCEQEAAGVVSFAVSANNSSSISSNSSFGVAEDEAEERTAAGCSGSHLMLLHEMLPNLLISACPFVAAGLVDGSVCGEQPHNGY
ncbi:hypothetical protein Nepgr_005833 [Nepenthes gracilis]|uniref:Uncharacterized protein n=1 Tax=Nepenthes gracilis TaxID=150966 RepID=A0AAD3S3X7_NEPGR|nr:hypothetical protein Nepgr_005833 [Nepenthes gracilis]